MKTLVKTLQGDDGNEPFTFGELLSQVVYSALRADHIWCYGRPPTYQEAEAYRLVAYALFMVDAANALDHRASLIAESRPGEADPILAYALSACAYGHLAVELKAIDAALKAGATA